MASTRDPDGAQRPCAPAAPDSAGRPDPGWGSVDASMQLLREVMDQPLDPSYAQVARRRARGEHPGRWTRILTGLLAVACGWAVTRGASELRRPQPSQAAGRTALEVEIARRISRADAQQRTVRSLGVQIRAAQQAALAAQGGTALAAQERRLALITGELPVTGPGLEITLDNAATAPTDAAGTDPRISGGTDAGTVQDRDLQIVVNGLWGAGAEAIAVNGHRLTALAAIRSAGAAIFVDFRPLVPPYVVQAIGDPRGLQTRFGSDQAGGYLRSLQDAYGIRSVIRRADELRLPAAGTFTLRLASVGSADPSSSTPHVSTPVEVTP